MDSYTWFRNMVRDRRHMDDATLQRVTDGRVFTGRQGLELKLIDQIGNEKTAVDWLAKEKGLKANTPVRDWQLKSRLGDLTMLHLGVRFALEAHRVERGCGAHRGARLAAGGRAAQS